MLTQAHSSHRTPQSAPNQPPGSLPSKQPQSQRMHVEYLMQYEKWDQLRQKVKSMQINRIGVTSYLGKQGRGTRGDGGQGVVRSEAKLEPYQSNCGKESEKDKEKWEEEFNVSRIAAQNKIYSSRNKQKMLTKAKTFIPYTPYFSHAYQLQKIRPATNHSKPKHQPSSQNPQQSCNLDQQSKRQRIKEFALSSQIESKPGAALRPNRSRERKKINTSASYYKKNRPVNVPRTSKAAKVYTNDLIEFAGLKAEDYTLRTIIRRKSNIVGSCMQAIEASILAQKILLFTVDITSGNANYFAQIKSKPPTDIFNDNCESVRPVSELPSKAIAHTTTGSHQMRLMMGSGEIAEFLEMFGLSRHPLEIGASVNKLGVVLVDFVRVTERGLRIDRGELAAGLANLSLETKNITMQEVYKQLKSNQLIRWKNTKKSQNRAITHTNPPTHNLTHNANILSHQNEPQSISRQSFKDSQVEAHKIYGHPHPKINSKEYELIKSYQKEKEKETEKQCEESIGSQVVRVEPTISASGVDQVINADSQVISRKDEIVEEEC